MSDESTNEMMAGVPIADANAKNFPPITGGRILFLILLGLVLAAFSVDQLLSLDVIKAVAVGAAVVPIIFSAIFAMLKNLPGRDLFPDVSGLKLLLFAITGLAYFLLLQALHQNTLGYTIFQYAAPALLMITLAIELYPFVAKGKPGEHKGTLIALTLGMALAAFALFPGANISGLLTIPLFTPAIAAGLLILGACLYDYASSWVRPAEASVPSGDHFVSQPSSPITRDTLANQSIFVSPNSNNVPPTPESVAASALNSMSVSTGSSLFGATASSAFQQSVPQTPPSSSATEDERNLSLLRSVLSSFSNANTSLNTNSAMTSSVPPPSSSSMAISSETTSAVAVPVPTNTDHALDSSSGSVLPGATEASSSVQSSGASSTPSLVLPPLPMPQSINSSHSDSVPIATSASSDTGSAPSVVPVSHHHASHHARSGSLPTDLPGLDRDDKESKHKRASSNGANIANRDGSPDILDLIIHSQDASSFAQSSAQSASSPIPDEVARQPSNDPHSDSVSASASRNNTSSAPAVLPPLPDTDTDINADAMQRLFNQ